MKRKTFAALVLAVFAIFAGPATLATAYVPNSSVSVSGTPTPGSTITVNFARASFSANEDVSFAVTGKGLGTLTDQGTADAEGAASFSFKLPSDAAGSYNVTATGLESGKIATTTITVVSADAGSGSADDDGGLAFTGGTVSPVVVWTAGGVLVLGIVLIAAMGLVRRKRSNA